MKCRTKGPIQDCQDSAKADLPIIHREGPKNKIYHSVKYLFYIYIYSMLHLGLKNCIIIIDLGLKICKILYFYPLKNVIGTLEV